MAKHRKPSKLTGRKMILGGIVSAGSLLGVAAPALAATVEVPQLPGVAVELPSSVVKAVQNAGQAAEKSAIAKAYKADPRVHNILEQIRLFGRPTKEVKPAVKKVQTWSGDRVVSAARTRIGSPYVWGATGPNSFDCSGLVKWSYQQIGMLIPRTSQEQVSSGSAVAKANLKPGDVVAFYSGASHVGVYSGSNKVIHAATEGVPVREAAVDSMPYYGAARYI